MSAGHLGLPLNLGFIILFLVVLLLHCFFESSLLNFSALFAVSTRHFGRVRQESDRVAGRLRGRPDEGGVQCHAATPPDQPHHVLRDGMGEDHPELLLLPQVRKI